MTEGQLQQIDSANQAGLICQRGDPGRYLRIACHFRRPNIRKCLCPLHFPCETMAEDELMLRAMLLGLVFVLALCVGRAQEPESKPQPDVAALYQAAIAGNAQALQQLRTIATRGDCRAVQSWLDLRKRLRRSAGYAKRFAGIASPPIRASPTRNITSAISTRAAKARPRITPKRCAGIASPPNRASPAHNTTWDTCMPAAKVRPRTTSKRLTGFTKPPIRRAPRSIQSRYVIRQWPRRPTGLCLRAYVVQPGSIPGQSG